MNPFETCECDGQFFSSQDCSQAFFCNDNVQGSMGYLTECPDGQIIRPNFLQNTVQCINRVSNYQCPGSFKVECPANEIVLDPESCQCDGQV